jgi:hypothetical protein
MRSGIDVQLWIDKPSFIASITKKTAPENGAAPNLTQ